MSLTAEQFYQDYRNKHRFSQTIDPGQMLKEFAEIKCNEQKHLVFEECKHIKFGTYGAKKEKMLNAPTPKM